MGSFCSPAIAGSLRPRRPSSPTTTASARSTCPSTPTSRSSARPRTRPPATRSLPDDRYMRTLDPWVQSRHRRRRHLAGAAVHRGRAARRARPASRWRSPSPRSTICPAAGSASASDSAGTPTNSPTTTCRRAGGAPCCASTSRPCARCGRRKKPNTTASSSTSAPAGRGPSRSSRTSRCSSGRRAPRRTSSGSPKSADGWITTPRDFDIDAPVKLLQDTWAAAGRDGAPQIVALDFKPDPEKLAHWRELGVTEVLFGLPDKPSRRGRRPTSSDSRASSPRWS